MGGHSTAKVLPLTLPIPETPLLDVEECYTYLSELLLRHAVHVSLHMPLTALLAPIHSLPHSCTLVRT